MVQKYIIGDLVKVILDDEEQVVKVIGYGPTYKSYLLANEYIYGTRGCISVTEDKIKPIRLTRKILKKNGWYGVTHSKQSDDNTKILYKTFKRNSYPTIKVSQDLKITCELSPFIVKLESVSDLQHLLFGLGINHKMEV